MSTSTLPPLLLGGDAEHVAFVLAQIARIRAIQREWAPAIIAQGVFTDSPDAAIAALASADPFVAEAERRLEDFFEHAGHNERIPFPLKGDPDHQDWAADVAGTRAYGWGDAGFLVGLAVGMMLSPHAFGGAK
jgi:hypothetical protein